MARRLGNETVQLWTRGMEQYGKPRQDEMVAQFQQCWVEFASSDEGVSGQSNIATVLSAIWVPAEVELQDAEDYFVWTRRPDEKYRTTGDVGRHYDRRGNLRACVIPAAVRK